MPLELVALVLAAATLWQTPADQESADAARQERLQFIKQKVGQFALYRESSPQEALALTDKPVLRPSIPERENGTWDGAMFLWLERARPVAAITVSIRRPNNLVMRELTSLSGAPLICRKSGEVIWTPQAGGLLHRELPDAPPPADGMASRLTQMRTLARRFSATCYRRDVATELRLLPQPLYRFSDDKEGILDGGLFALVVGNDAELLLLLEAAKRPTTDKPSWRFSLARMSSLEHKVRLDDAEVWAIPRYYDLPAAERKTGPYVEAPEGKFTASAGSADGK